MHHVSSVWGRVSAEIPRPPPIKLFLSFSRLRPESLLPLGITQMTSYERMSCEHRGFTDYGTVTVGTARLCQWLETHFHMKTSWAKRFSQDSQPIGIRGIYCHGSHAAGWVVGLTHASIWAANNIPYTPSSTDTLLENSNRPTLLRSPLEVTNLKTTQIQERNAVQEHEKQCHGQG